MMERFRSIHPFETDVWDLTENDAFDLNLNATENDVHGLNLDAITDNDSFDLNLSATVVDVLDHGLLSSEIEEAPVVVDNQGTEVYFQDYIPKMGMVFNSESEAYEFYNQYARIKGFSVRKSLKKTTKSGLIRKRQYVCSKEGVRANHPRGPPKKPRANTRTGCLARIVFKISDDENWVVIKFVEEHNHNLASNEEAHLLKSQRKVYPTQGKYMDSLQLAGCGPTQIYSIMSAEHGGPQNLNITKKDCYNYYQRKRNEIYKKGDAQVALNYFRSMQRENPAFSYAIQLDNDHQLCNLFWADTKSKIDYDYFGDVVCFDTTFRTNKYNMPCAPFVGVNHHGMSVIFGCALLLDETTESFVWVFESFLNAMSGKKPKTILTDQAQAIGKAIQQVMPEVNHRLCLWHIFQNAAKHLSHVYEVDKHFKTDFQDCIYNAETEEEFQSKWEELVQEYKLSKNDWLKTLYSIRHKWAVVYGREYFCAGMTTTQRSESVNSFFKGYVKSTISITEFITQYEKALLNWRGKEAEEDFHCKQSDPVLTSMSSFEKQASKVYTRKVFGIFQSGFKNFACYLDYLEEASGSTYVHKVELVEDKIWRDRDRSVIFDSKENSVVCSCKSYEFTGILCVHALKVLLSRRVFQIPSRYILKRWTKDAKAGVPIEVKKTTSQPDCRNSLNTRYSDLAHRALTIAVKGSMDKESQELVKRHLDACLIELDAYQINKESEATNATDVGGENHGSTERNDNVHLDENITIRNPAVKRKKGEQNSRYKHPMEKKSTKKKTKKKGKNAQEISEVLFASDGNEVYSSSDMVPMIAQGISRQHGKSRSARRIVCSNGASQGVSRDYNQSSMRQSVGAMHIPGAPHSIVFENVLRN